MTRSISFLAGVAALALTLAFAAPASACPKLGGYAKAAKKAKPSTCGVPAATTHATATFAFAVEDDGQSDDGRAHGACPYLAAKKQKKGCGAWDDAVFARAEPASCGGCAASCGARAETYARATDGTAMGEGADEAARTFVMRVIALFQLDGIVVAGAAPTPARIAAR